MSGKLKKLTFLNWPADLKPLELLLALCRSRGGWGVMGCWAHRRPLGMDCRGVVVRPTVDCWATGVTMTA